jgi:hypothetical protein
MVVGNGSIAKVFINDYQDDNSVVIFASGVSNSNEINESEFSREHTLLSKILVSYPNLKLVYFSSIYSTLVDNPYYNHKLKMENFINENFKNFIIIRLPQVISANGNKNNLINYFVDSLKNNKIISIQKSANRAIVDIQDVKNITKKIILNENNKILNFSHIEYVNVLDLFLSISNILNIKPKYNLIDPVFEIPKIDNSLEITNIIKQKIEKTNYTNKILKKYIS